MANNARKFVPGGCGDYSISLPCFTWQSGQIFRTSKGRHNATCTLSEFHANVTERRHLPIGRRRLARIRNHRDLLITAANACRRIAGCELIHAGQIQVRALGQRVIDSHRELVPPRLERRAAGAGQTVGAAIGEGVDADQRGGGREIVAAVHIVVIELAR